MTKYDLLVTFINYFRKEQLAGKVLNETDEQFNIDLAQLLNIIKVERNKLYIFHFKKNILNLSFGYSGCF